MIFIALGFVFNNNTDPTYKCKQMYNSVWNGSEYQHRCAQLTASLLNSRAQINRHIDMIQGSKEIQCDCTWGGFWGCWPLGSDPHWLRWHRPAPSAASCGRRSLESPLPLPPPAASSTASCGSLPSPSKDRQPFWISDFSLMRKKQLTTIYCALCLFKAVNLRLNLALRAKWFTTHLNLCNNWAAHRHIRMTSEGSCDTEDWSNDATNLVLP